VTRDHDVGRLTTAELERTMRDLRANLDLISPDSRRTSRSWLTCGRSTPSWPDVPVPAAPRRKAPRQRETSWPVARDPSRATLIEIRRSRECRADGR
jgi:hypothetical protein